VHRQHGESRAHSPDCLYWLGGLCSCAPPNNAIALGVPCSCSGAHSADELLCAQHSPQIDLDLYDPDVDGYHPNFEN